jgi:hypothetical protein
MSKASELEERRLAAERVASRCDALIVTSRSAGLEGVEIPGQLTVVAELLLAEATHISEQRRKGWQSSMREYAAAGRILEQWAKDLAAHLEQDKPPARPPIDLSDPAQRKAPDGTPSVRGLMDIAAGSNGTPEASWPEDGPITPDAATRVRLAIEAGSKPTDDAVLSVAFDVPPIVNETGLDPSVVDRMSALPTLDAAFGPPDRFTAAVEQHSAVVRSAVDKMLTADRTFGPQLLIHIRAAPTNYAWCSATYGLRAYVNTATCPECIAAWDAHHETLYDAKTDRRHPASRLASVKLDPPVTIEAPGAYTMAVLSAPDGTVIDASLTPTIPAFSEPGPPPAQPIDDKVTRGPEAWPMLGAAQYVIEDPAPSSAVVDIHGKPHSVALPSRFRSGILGVAYLMYEDGRCEVRSIDFRLDPPSQLEIIAASRTPDVPQFSEPGPAPARQTQQRMTFDAVREHGMARARGADHRSYSQVTSFAECGVRYALSDLDNAPAWWNVGGTALHYALEAINLQRGSDTWPEAFGRAISEAVAESGVTPDRWRAAKKGAEGYDWWRVQGGAMVGRWLQRLGQLLGDGWTIATIDGKPAVELSIPMTIQTFAGTPAMMPNGIKVENVIDLVLVRGDTFLIVDFKSGASAPDSTYQLGQYAHALARAIESDSRIQATMRIVGAYWLARSDMLSPVDVTKSDTTTDLRDLHPWPEIEYLITTMHAAESQGLYLPNKSKSDRFGCGSCGVAGLCPVGPS